MKTKLLYGALAVSLAFNLFFAIGYVTAKKRMQRMDKIERRVDFAAKRLALSDAQKKELRGILEASRQALRRLRRQERETALLFKEELKKPNPDIDRLKRAMADIEQMRRKSKEALAQRWRAFFDTLNDEQRKKAMRMLQKRPRLRKELMVPARERGDAV
ncbi:periplasmic heavy metal sensor [Hydrogenimonas urashimensis]|uniref:periplasmic heavy metal sensor n=1 Tax=Hydrogenimonas urashimensis TaxID=2740515 RepID=UPI001916940A|nr:periplasmic heavy metal sensor [Hydrogenimonas urashimensis]